MIKKALVQRKSTTWFMNLSPFLGLFLMGCGGGGGVANNNNTSNSISDSNNQVDQLVSENLPPVIGFLPTSVAEDEATIGRLNITDENSSSLIVNIEDSTPYAVTIDAQHVVQIVDVSLSSAGDIITFTISVTDDVGQSDERIFNINVEAADATSVSAVPEVTETSEDTVQVGLELSNVTTFNSVQFDIIFDPNILDYVEGSLESDFINSLVVNDTTSEAGLIRVAGISLQPISGAVGDIVSLDFNFLENTNSEIQFVNIFVDEVRLSAETVDVIA